MSWTIEIRLKNEDNEEHLLKIPKGHIFEKKSIGSGIQNVAAIKDYSVILPAQASITIDIEVLCINQRLSPPSGNYNLTCFKINQQFNDQEHLWSIMHP